MLHLTATEIRQRFLNGELSAVAIVKYFLERIHKLNPKLNAFLRVFDEKALERAHFLDQKKANNEPLGKLAGIPIAVKDNILVAGEQITCASKFMQNYTAFSNATVVDRVLHEDGIIIGITNMDEFAMGSSTENSAICKTFNPWALDSTPGGSSGGSAAAVAGRLVPLAFGSDTGGSIRQPASFCGVVGFKPTYGRVSRSGLVAFASSLDQIGPFAYDVSDAALLMEVIEGHCPKDSTSLPQPAEEYHANFKSDIKGLKIGVPTKFLEFLKPELKNLFDQSVKHAKDLGAEIVEIDLPNLDSSVAVYYIIATAEASTNLARFDGVRYGVRSKEAKNIDEVYSFSKEDGFGPEVKRRIMLGTYVLSSGYKDAYYKKAQKVRSLIIKSFQEAFKGCDIIAMPVAPSTAFELGSLKEPLQMYLEDIYSIPINLAGLPAISLPSSLDKAGKPFGLQLIGNQKQDLLVMSVAKVLESSLGMKNKLPPLFSDE